MSSLLSLIEGLWAHVGPGLLLVIALPVSLIVLVAIAAESWGRRVDRY